MHFILSYLAMHSPYAQQKKFALFYISVVVLLSINFIMETETINQDITQPIEPQVGLIVSGPVIATNKQSVFIDLSPRGTGIIYGREFLSVKDVLRKIKIGDSISAKIIEIQTEDGYIDLSLQEARKVALWNELEKAIKEKIVYEVTVISANRGGLIIELRGIRGFLPASQLTEDNYPKVLNGNKDSILEELKKLIGKRLNVNISSADVENEKIIFAEARNANSNTDSTSEGMSKKVEYKIGDIRSGVVTCIVDFGLFVKIDEKAEGLVHISQIDWGLVDDPKKFYSVGDYVEIKIIDIQNSKYSFSIKELMKNPWSEVDKKYKVGDTVSGVVVKYNTHGAFASIQAGVTGLVHISNYKDEIEFRTKIEIGKTYDFIITGLSTAEQKLILTPKDVAKTTKQKGN